MQKERTIFAAWAVLATVALPCAQSAHANSSWTSTLSADSPINPNPLNLENGNTVVLNAPLSLPLVGKPQGRLNLETVTGRARDLSGSVRTGSINVGKAKLTAGASGTVGALEDDLGTLRLNLQMDAPLAAGTLTLNLNSTLNALEEANTGAIGLAGGWTTPEKDGLSLNATARTNLDGDMHARVGLRFRFDVGGSSTPSAPLDFDWSQWERPVGHSASPSMWGIGSWDR